MANATEAMPMPSKTRYGGLNLGPAESFFIGDTPYQSIWFVKAGDNGDGCANLVV
jgi:hypothetical protein